MTDIERRQLMNQSAILMALLQLLSDEAVKDVVREEYRLTGLMLQAGRRRGG